MKTDSTKHGIFVAARGHYLPERSNPLIGQYLFGYDVRISNVSRRSAMLIGRHWIITDGFGRVEEVQGVGVVGKQPRLEPGTCFEYRSACPLPPQFGVTRGFYHLIDDSGVTFSVPVSPFELEIQAALN